MAAFIPKKIEYPESIGHKLCQARNKKNLQIKDIAKKLNIRPEYLAALEEDRFENLPAGLYGKNFIKEYSSFLGLNSKEILKNWNQQAGRIAPDDPFSRKIPARHKFIIFPRIIRNALIIAAICICFLYLIFYFKKVILPPKLLITSPASNLSLQATNITITGQTEPEAEVKINGEIVLNNHGGYFTQTVNLKKGLNNINITAKKKYSREQTAIRQILIE